MERSASVASSRGEAKRALLCHLGRKARHAAAGFLDLVIGAGQAHAQPAAQRFTKAFAWHHRHMFLVEQPPGESIARQTCGADVDHGEHPRLGQVDTQVVAVQEAVDQLRPAREAAGHVGGNGRGARDGKGRHVGDEGLVAEEHGLGNRQEAVDKGARADGPPRAEPRSGVGFGDGGHDDGTLGQRGFVQGRGEAGTFENQLLVDLVADDPKVMGAGDFADGEDVFAGQHGAGGVVRGVQEDGTAAVGHARGNVGGLKAEAMFRAQRHGHDRGAGGGHHAFVGGIHRVADKHFVTRPGHGHQHGVKAGLGAGQADDLVGANRPAGAAAVLLGQGGQKAGLAPAIGIAVSAGMHGLGRLGQKVRRRRHVGFADGQRQDLNPGGGHGLGADVDLPLCPAQMGQAVGDGGVSHGVGGSESRR